MWQDDLVAFSRAHKIKPSQAQRLQCTAEHLDARQDGGVDTAQNIVAACWSCNQRRHKRPKPPAPGAYLSLVQQRVRAGRWHCAALLTAFGMLRSGRDSPGQAAT
ncbi:HNH endonuclease [Candidatus Accumulibacter sp. ACC012]|uniref:HNH endonuclease n=1 Tax=Candidatus Accumulibacter sp. ACC012 TaxID=2823332 RepID=UPI0025C2EEE8|nr:HNH endonuclease [Candidatus Accumulibacter sp. ACC012]